MFARVSQFQQDAATVDETTREDQERFVPQAEKIPGFLGLVSLANRETGAMLTITYWESEEAMRASEEEADRIRKESAELAEAEIRSVERYEVLLRVGL
jgi:heme-degrading monooxygenase HmoA